MRNGMKLFDKRDCFAVNLFWMYGSGLITKKRFQEYIDKIKYDLAKEKKVTKR